MQKQMKFQKTEPEVYLGLLRTSKIDRFATIVITKLSISGVYR